MKLSAIRATQNIEELKPAIKHLAVNMQQLTFGEFVAMKNTIQSKADEFGVTYREINELAAGYQEDSK